MDGGIAGGDIRPHRFTVADVYRMADAGIIDEDSRVKLISGQIVDMAAVGGPDGGQYRLVAQRGLDQSVSIAAFPDLVFPTADILPG